MKQVLSTVEHGAQQKGDTGKEFVNTGDRGHEREKEKKKKLEGYYTHIICNTHVYYSVLTYIMEKIAAMGICKLGIFRRDFSYDLLCDFCEVPGTRCMFCEDYRASRNNTVEDTHGQLLTS